MRQRRPPSDLGVSTGSTARSAARSVRNRVRYRFDRLLSRGSWAVLLWLGMITLLAVSTSAALLAVTDVTFAGSEGTSLVEDFWQSLLRVMDPGTMVNDVGWGRRILALIVTLTGLLLAGTLIGLIAAGVERRVERLRQGRSIVVESDHYVVLGWSERLRVVINQLTAPDSNVSVVVLADRDASAMDDDLRPALDRALGRRLVVRSGDPRLQSGLVLTNLGEARAVIVLADDTWGAGTAVVTTVLMVGRQVGFDGLPIVVEVSDDVTREKLQQATGPSVRTVIVAEAASRLATLVGRQPGLSEVVEALVDSSGPGIHVVAVPRLVGRSFGDAVFGLDKARPIGLIEAGGELTLNPTANRILEAGDRLVTVAADSDVAVVGERRAPLARDEPVRLDVAPAPIRLLFIGWNRIGSDLLAEFDRFAAAGSSAIVQYDATLHTSVDIVVPPTMNIGVAVHAGSDPAERLRDAGITAVVLLADDGLRSAAAADGRTLLDLALLERELLTWDSPTPQLMVQLLDEDRSTLAELAGLDGFLISEGVGSALIAQLADVPERQDVFQRLYDPERASIHLVNLVRLGIDAPVTFGDIVARTYSAGALAIGLLTSHERGRRAVLSPALNAEVEPSDLIVMVG